MRCLAGLLLTALLIPALHSQAPVKRLDPSLAPTQYSFSIHSGMEPFRFQVEIDQTSTITGVSVFRTGDSLPFQTLNSCPGDLRVELNEYDAGRELLRHADLHFNGFEDIELLQFFDSHLGTSVYCIYAWDRKAGRFLPAPEIPNINPVPHPENRTITVHQDYFGGVYNDRTYRWRANGMELFEENGRLYSSEDEKCGFTDFCSRRIRGKMATTASRPAVCEGQPDGPPLVCPTASERR